MQKKTSKHNKMVKVTNKVKKLSNWAMRHIELGDLLSLRSLLMQS